MATNEGTQRFGGLAGDLDGKDDERLPLVLLHGLALDRSMWGPALEELRVIDPGRRVLALDLPGHGESVDTFTGIDDVPAQIHAAILEAGLNAPVVVGHSGAGIGATFYAAALPTRGVVNVDVSLHVEPFAALVQSLASELRGPAFRQAWDRIFSGVHAKPIQADAEALIQRALRPRQDVVLGYFAQMLEQTPAAVQESVTGALRSIAAADLPYSIIMSAEPEARYRSWLEGVLPRATLAVWPGSEHFPQLARPKAFARVLAGTGSQPWTAVDERPEVVRADAR